MSDSLARAPYVPVWSSSAIPAAAPEPPAPAPAPRIRIAPAPSLRATRRTRPRMFYAVTACAGIAVIFIVKLLLSVAISEGAYETATLETANKNLTRAAQTATESLDRVRSPQYLAANAAALGMVSNTHPVYLRLSDGAVLGQPQRADGSGASSGALVPNSLVTGAPLVTQQPAPGAAPAPTAAGATDTAAAAAAATPDPAAPPEPTALPTPVTH